MRIPDPIEISLSRAERLADQYVDEHTCMECGKKVDYELLCPSPVGDGPAICIECLGFDPFAKPQ
ncbi:hypothetical protein [Pseudomonas abietaniphila]